MNPGGKAAPIRIGISSCLLGEQVRYDGGHKRDNYITETLGRYFEFIPVCPEVAIGLGIPRAPIRLTGDPDAPRAVGLRDPDLDVTDQLSACGARMARELDGISGYILKSRSPSCGMERVKVYQSRQPGKSGRGIYARAFMTRQPLLPVEEEGRLGDPVVRDNFLERIFAYRRWQDLTDRGITPARLVEFHTAHKLSLMAHGIEQYRALGQRIAQAGKGRSPAFARDYIADFMTALRHRATRTRHTNVLMHIMGYLKQHLGREDKAELLELITAYRIGRVPLIVPVTLLRHHFRRHPSPYIAQQTYMDPHPSELMLRVGI